jgi:hypothetical protein
VNVVSRTKWSRFSMVHCERTIAARRCGDACRLVRSVMMWTVSRVRLPVLLLVRWWRMHRTSSHRCDQHTYKIDPTLKSPCCQT